MWSSRRSGCDAATWLVWTMADWTSRSAQSRSNVAASIQVPSQPPHSSRSTAPTVTHAIAALHAGHFEEVGAVASIRLRATPQCGQNDEPANRTPRHLGHETVASVDWQYSQRADSGATGAPQFGHRSVAIGSPVIAPPA